MAWSHWAGPPDASVLTLRVKITEDRLRKSLREARRSITWKSIEQFLDEIFAHSPTEAESVSLRLLGSSDQRQ